MHSTGQVMKPRKLQSIPRKTPAQVIVLCIVLTVILQPLTLHAQASPLNVPVDQTALSAVGLAILATGKATPVTAIKTTALNFKQIQDAVATAVIKTVINLVRDMVIRWIMTGRFEGPVFSTSFSFDASKAAENASRIFLSKLTGINFCTAFGPPSIRSFPFNLDLFLTCTLDTPGKNFDYVDFFFNPTKYGPEEAILIRSLENDYVSVTINTIRAKADIEARALISNAAELIVGQGFKGIRDEFGKYVTPPQIVKSLAIESIITSPQRQVDVANTIQQAIGAILEAAVRAIIERGLTAASSRS